MIRYEIKGPRDPHWDSVWLEIKNDHGPIKYPFDIDSFLKKYGGKVYMDDRYSAITVIRGIQFKSEEDLIMFKLRFN